MHIFPRNAARPTARHARLLFVGLPLLAAVLTGCGGGSDGADPSTSAHVRDFNAVPNGGVASVTVGGLTLPGSSVTVNGSEVTGQGFLTASSYSYVTAGARQATFALSGESGTTYPAAAQTLTAGAYYTEVLLGRADVAATDPRYPALLGVPDDRTAPAAGDARLRIVQAAPDAGSVDVRVDGQVVASGAAYRSAGGYLNVAAGSRTVQVNAAGTSTVLVAAQTVTLTAGKIYSLFAVEPALSPAPSYALQLQSDAD